MSDVASAHFFPIVSLAHSHCEKGIVVEYRFLKKLYSCCGSKLTRVKASAAWIPSRKNFKANPGVTVYPVGSTAASDILIIPCWACLNIPVYFVSELGTNETFATAPSGWRSFTLPGGIVSSIWSKLPFMFSEKNWGFSMMVVNGIDESSSFTLFQIFCLLQMAEKLK